MPLRDNTILTSGLTSEMWLPPKGAAPKPIRLRCRLGIHVWGPWVDAPDEFVDRSNFIHQRRRCLCCNITERSEAR